MRDDRIYSFSGMYPEGLSEELHRTDLSGIESTNLYCSEEAGEEILAHIREHGPYGIHLIDHGNYHYMTRWFLEDVKGPVTLAVFDHHTDLQEDGLFGLLSCGNWIRAVLEECPAVRNVILIGPTRAAAALIDEKYLSRLSVICEEDLLDGGGERLLQECEITGSLWVSADLDILDGRYFASNWDHGLVEPALLYRLLKQISAGQRVIGVDICGGDPSCFGPKEEEIYRGIYDLMRDSVTIEPPVEAEGGR